MTQLPEGPNWTYEVKLDGFRLEAVKAAKDVILYSRRGNVLNEKFPRIVQALSALPPSTILDGEVVALDENHRPDFNLLQNFRTAEAFIHYYAFDLLVLKGKSLLGVPLTERRATLAKIPPDHKLIGLSAVDPSLSHLLKFVTGHGLRASSPSVRTASTSQASARVSGLSTA